MKIHEFQAKQLLREAGIAVPAGIAARTPDEAAAAFDQLGGKLAVVKAQIHAGGRGKGTIKTNPSQRGVQLVKSAEEAATVAKNLLGNKLVTIQTGPEGQTVRQVFVEAGCDISRRSRDTTPGRSVARVPTSTRARGSGRAGTAWRRRGSHG
jgi:succinyl-CoA synthetase beta subunit